MMSTESQQRSEADAIRVRQLAAARVSSQDEVAGGPLSGQRLPQGTRLRELAADRLARIGLDADTVERELAAERPANERLLEELKADAVAQSVPRAESLKKLVDDYAADLGELVVTTGHPTKYVILDTADDILTPSDHLDVVAAVKEQYNSYAKVRREARDGLWEWDRLVFRYEWWNPHPDAYAVTTASTTLVLNGFCSTHSEGGVLASNHASLELVGRLILRPSWTESHLVLPQPSQQAVALKLESRSDGLVALDDTDSKAVFDGCYLRYEQLFVPPGEGVMLDVTLDFYTEVYDGKVSANFASGRLSVQSPLVLIAFATA